ncbi:MAG: S8 family peptidase [Candidatus Omnitrophota bacterium]
MANERYQHIFLSDRHSVRDFTSVSSFGATFRIPVRDRQTHSQYLISRLQTAWQDAENEQAVMHVAREGVYIEFKSDPGAALVLKSLEDMRSKKVRLLNVRVEKENDQEVTYATVYVSNDKRNHFLKKIQDYATKTLDSGHPKNEPLVNSIADIRKALLVKSFWRDREDLIPSDEKEWCEVWLSNDKADTLERFDVLLAELQVQKADGFIRFPERIVKLVYVNKALLEKLTTLSEDIAEYRRAKETAAFWLDMSNREQAEWVRELLQRSTVDAQTKVAVCVLDTGINNGHPLLGPVLSDQDCQTVDSSWGVDDHDGHGTMMAGVCVYGDLKKCLSSSDPVHLKHRIESVKILPKPPEKTDSRLWGYVTAQAVSRAEIQSPDAERIICMAVTAMDTRDNGHPSSWSGALDNLSSGADDQKRRLIILSAGNTKDLDFASKYPESQQTDEVHDPAQAWNVLTVGAYTEFEDIQDPSLRGFKAIAPQKGLSPFTTTSLDWDDKWPIKPEILMEGGNLANDGSRFSSECDDLSLLTTFYQPASRLFCSFNMTSAAAAQAAWFAARIQKAYPNMWPETVRGLMVHSAEWTDVMKAQFLQDESKKTSYTQLLRTCGYGVPNLGKALYSATNSLTLIAQAELQPFARKGDGSGFKTNEMHLHELPWPKDALLNLPPNADVSMKVTLSYFVEPGPGEIGWQDKYRYQSHALRFDVKSPGESTDLFIRRINAAARAENEGHPGTASAADHWQIGAKQRDKGSIHSDVWKGSAAELADSGSVVVYPVIGWWRERHYLNCWNKKCRYTLIVSIFTPAEQVDIYTPVAAQIGITTPVEISI